MERKIEDGQLYEILQNCLLALRCPRTRHYPNKNFGSRLREIDGVLTEKAALAYARQAVSEMDGVLIESAALSDGGVRFCVLVNNEKGEVTVGL